MAVWPCDLTAATADYRCRRCRPGCAIWVGPSRPGHPGGDGAPVRLRQASGSWQTAGRAVPSGMKRRSTPV